MECMEYNLELDKICRIINRRKYKTVELQIPDGLKTKFDKIAGYIERETGATVLISGEPCYGACDAHPKVSETEFLLHLGHAKMYSTSESVFFAECMSDIDVSVVVKKAVKELGKRVGLVTTVQHIHKVNKIKDILEKNRKKVFIGMQNTKRIKYPAQVLGCNFSTALAVARKIDNFLYVGSGNFHPLGIAIATDKKVIAADPYTNQVRDMNELKNKFLKQRWGAISKTRDARKFIIILSTKKGQKRLCLAKKLKKTIENCGREAYIIALENIEPNYLAQFNCDAYVCTACPRIAIDDFMKYTKPMVTPPELEIALGMRKNYGMDRIE